MTENKKCILPWIHMHGDTDGIYKLCCHVDNKDANSTDLGYHTQSFNEVWNDEPMRRIRRMYLRNEVPQECYVTCHKKEEQSRGLSFRTQHNSKWAHKHYLWDTTNPDGSVDEPISYFDIRWSNVCNFKCRICGPRNSTKWISDYKKLTGKVPYGVQDYWADNDKLWNDIPTFIDNVEEVYFAGGEPLMMDEHYKLLEYLIENNKTDLQLTYNTNLSVLKYKHYDLRELWGHFKRIVLWPSIDGMGKEAEYSRSGLNWNQFQKNAILTKDYITTMSCVISIFSIHSAIELIKWCNNYNFNWFGTTLHTPTYFSIQCLPKEEKKIILNKYKDFLNEYKNALKPDEIKHVMTWLSFMMAEDNSHLLPKFKANIESLDLIRKEKFLKVYPQYEHWYSKI